MTDFQCAYCGKDAPTGGINDFLITGNHYCSQECLARHYWENGRRPDNAFKVDNDD